MNEMIGDIMEVKCSICGKIEEINKVHKDYKKMLDKPSSVYICELCNMKLTVQAAKKNAVLDKK